MIYIFFSPQPEEQLACTFSHGEQFLLGIATEIVIVTISVPIPRKGRNRSISMVGHPFQNYDIVYVGFFAAYNRL